MRKVKEKVIELARLNNSPREIAFGISLGVFIAHSPFYGLQTLAALILAVFIRRINRIAILTGLLVTIPPAAPFVYWAEYRIGKFVLGNNYPSFSWASVEEFIRHGIYRFFYPLFVGSIILGFFSSLVFYFVTLVLVRKIRARHSKSTRVGESFG